MTNRFGAQCYRCEEWVSPGAGTIFRTGSGWAVTHTAWCEVARHTVEPSAGIVLHRECGRVKPGLEVGRSFRAGPDDGRHAGRVVTVVRQIRSYVSPAEAEDAGEPGSDGWTLMLGCRLATAEESAIVEAAERAATRTVGVFQFHGALHSP